jgi:hypothetical protein
VRIALTTIGLILMWVTVLWRVRLGRTGLPERALTVTVTALALGFTLDQPLIAAGLDLGPLAVPNLADVLKHACILLGAAGARETMELHLHDERTARQGRSVRLLVAVAAVAALGVLFALSPARSAETTSLTVATATDGYMLGYWMVYVAFLGAVLIPITRTMYRFARHTEPSSIRTTFALISAGTGAGVLYVVHKAAFIVLRLFQVRGGWLVDHYDQVSTLLIAASVIPLVIGLMWQYLVRMPVARHAVAYRALGVLHPLWWRLCEATPEIALTPHPAGGHDERPGPHDVDYCLQRRVIEIRDGVLALRPYLGLSHSRRTEDALAMLGVSERDRELLAEAAWIEVARRAKLAGVQPTSDQVRTAAGAADLAGEIRTLTRVAKNLPVVDVAADLLDDPRKVRV